MNKPIKIPDGWTLKKFGEVAEFKNGINYDSDSKGRSVAIVGVADFKDHFYLQTDTLSSVTVDSLSEDYLLKNGDLLFVRSNGNKALVGRVLYIDGICEDTTFSGFTIRARIKDDAIISQYIALYCSTSIVKEQYRVKSGGTNISNLNQQILSDIDLLLPSKAEQERIIEIIQTWDNAIALKAKLIEQKRLQMVGLMQNLLTGKIRFNDGTNCTRNEISQRLKTIRQGDVPQGYKKTKVGIIPENWKVFKAKDLFRNVSDKNHNGNLEVLSSTQDRGVIPRSQLDIDIKYDEGSLTTYKRVIRGDFIISLRSFQGGIEYSLYDGIVSPSYIVLRNKTEIDHDFYRFLFKSQNFITRLQSVIYGIRDGKQIGFKDFGELPLQFAPINEQRKISEVLSVCEREIELLEQELNALKEQKRGLMQLLLTGKVRVQV